MFMQYVFILSILFLSACSFSNEPKPTIDTMKDYPKAEKPIIDSSKIPYTFQDTLRLSKEDYFLVLSYPNFLSEEYSFEYSKELLITNNEDSALSVYSYIPGSYFFKQIDADGNLIIDANIEVVIEEDLLGLIDANIEDYKEDKHYVKSIRNNLLYNEFVHNQVLEDYSLNVFENGKIVDGNLYDLLVEDKINVLYLASVGCGFCDLSQKTMEEMFANKEFEELHFIYIENGFMKIKNDWPTFEGEYVTVKFLGKNKKSKEFVEAPKLNFVNYFTSAPGFAEKHYSEGTPTFLFLNKNNEVFYKINGFIGGPDMSTGYFRHYLLNQLKLIKVLNKK